MSELSIGERVVVRGSTWMVQDIQSWPGCTVIQLHGVEGQPSRSLLCPFDRPRPVARRSGARVVGVSRWLGAVRRHAADLSPFGGAVAVSPRQVRLLPYQLEPLLAALRHGVTRMLIADAVGLGKTIQAGLLLLELSTRDDGCRALVLVPAGLRQQWADELQAQLGMASVQADAEWLRAAAATHTPDVNPWALPGIYIASIDFAKRAEVLQAVEAVSWDLLVVDEAHLATAASDRREAAHAIALRSRRVLLLTATPDYGDPARFASLCRIGELDANDPALTMFRRSRAEVAAGSARRSVLLRVHPTPAERHMHDLLERYAASVWQEAGVRRDGRARLAVVVLRKRALSSAASLLVSVQRRIALLSAGGPPPDAQQRLPLADEDTQDDEVDDAALAVPGLADGRREHRWLAAISEAARGAARGESKSQRLVRWLARVREPVIVFTEFRDTLLRLEAVIRATGRALVVLHGGLDRQERSMVQRRFNAGGLSLLATDAAAEGLNLHHHCRIVLHYELPWRPARLEQRAGRVDRLGQARRVHEVALVAADTAERLVLAPLAARAARARAAGGVSAGLLESMPESAISELIMAPGVVLAPAVAASDLEPAPFRTIDLRREAEQEVARLQEPREAGLAFGHARARDAGVRGTDARSMRRSRAARRERPATLIARLDSRRTRLPSGLIVVFDLALTDVAGRRVHAESATFALQHEARWSRNVAAAALRQRVYDLRAIAACPGSALRRHLDDAVAAMRVRVVPLHAAARARLAQREQTLRRALPSSARKLVQAGLFDRRELHARFRREAVRDAQLYDADARLQSLDPGMQLMARYELVAVLVIERRRPALP